MRLIVCLIPLLCGCSAPRGALRCAPAAHQSAGRAAGLAAVGGQAVTTRRAP